MPATAFTSPTVSPVNCKKAQKKKTKIKRLKFGVFQFYSEAMMSFEEMVEVIKRLSTQQVIASYSFSQIKGQQKNIDEGDNNTNSMYIWKRCRATSPSK